MGKGMCMALCHAAHGSPLKPPEGEIKIMVFTVPATAFAAVSEKLEKLNKRALKKGLAPMTVERVGERMVRTGETVECYCEERKMMVFEPVAIRMIDFNVIGEPPKIDGYTALGMIDYRDGFPMVVNFGRGEVPAEFHKADTKRCDACGHNRQRNRVIILRKNDDGSHIQTGTECLKDYVGHSVDAIVAYANMQSEIRGFDDDNFCGGIGDNHNDIVDVIAASIADIRTHGFVSRNAALERSIASTADTVRRHFNGGDPLPVTEADYAKARTVITWGAAMDGGTEYAHNVRAICEAGVCGNRSFNLTVSIPAAYDRAQEKARAAATAKADAKQSQHVGTVGQRFDKKNPLRLKVTFKRVMNGGQFFKVLYKFTDEQGRLFTWWASVDVFNQDDDVTLTATVKAHDYDKYLDGAPVTVLTRCKAL